ncbi:hypothetical protein RvY_05815 [Ramazzottius varieornatus]|uniref:Uncharacterized protein n=1 Tax=Ramazzottius varieornatus TaxID=947166 RepID=A0A1D1UZY6_RAMVA|nr:hypothetical protein RvY_05815 [Ramazzottius varieornatus]
MLKCGCPRKLLIGLFLLTLRAANIGEARMKEGRGRSVFRKSAEKPYKSSFPEMEHRKAVIHTVRPQDTISKEHRLSRKEAISRAQPSDIVRWAFHPLRHGRSENGTQPRSRAKTGRIRGLDDLALRFREWDNDARYLHEPRAAVLVPKRSRILGGNKPSVGSTSERPDRTDDRRPTRVSTAVDDKSSVQYAMLLAGEQYARDQSQRTTTIGPNTTTSSPSETDQSWAI